MNKLIYSLFLFLFCASLNAQTTTFPVKLTVPSDGTVIYSPITDTNSIYIITVEGTYSMWERKIGDSSACYGVDAVWIYDVPQAEIDNFRWPPQETEILGNKIKIFELPRWVGDANKYPSDNLMQYFPLFKTQINLKEMTGFRMDNTPLPSIAFTGLTHRYQIEKRGTGAAFKFNILDSVYSILDEKNMPAYSNNCGFLTVTITKVMPDIPEPEICDIEIIAKDKIITGIRLWASIFVEDTTSVSGKKNLLSNIGLNQIGIVENGRFICDIEKIVCDTTRTAPINFGLMVDRSGSMGFPIDTLSPDTTRMQALKIALSNFVLNMKSTDEAFLLSFANNVTLDQDWTNDKQKLITAVNNLIALGATSFNDALIQSLDKISKKEAEHKFLIILSDGANNQPPFISDEALIDSARNANIPIYIIKLGLSDSPEDLKGSALLDRIAAASNGKTFSVKTASELNEIYKKLSKEIAQDDCCAIYFKVLPCDSLNPNPERYYRIVYTPSDTLLLTKVIKVVIPDTLCTTGVDGGIINPDGEDGSGISVSPNPFSINAQIEYDLLADGEVTIGLYDVMGIQIEEIFKGVQAQGKQSLKVNGTNFSSGVYFIVVKQHGEQVSKKVIIIQ